MKKLLTVVTLISSLFICGQEKNSPTVVVLNSQETIIPPELDSIAQLFVYKGLSEEERNNIREENGNFKLKAEKEIEFLEETDITTNISYGLNYFLSYKFFEYFPNLLIYPARELNQSDLESLKSISEKHNVNWVVNIKKIKFIFESGNYGAEVEFQLYNQKTNQILIEKIIAVDDTNPGFEFACENGTINCVINNTVSRLSSEIMTTMGKDKKYWR